MPRDFCYDAKDDEAAGPEDHADRGRSEVCVRKRLTETLVNEGRESRL